MTDFWFSRKFKVIFSKFIISGNQWNIQNLSAIINKFRVFNSFIYVQKGSNDSYARFPLWWLIIRVFAPNHTEVSGSTSLKANPYQRAIFILREISKIILFEQWKKISEMFKTIFKSIFKFRICSYFMYLKVLIGNNMRLYFWKFSQIKNRTQVRMGHCIVFWLDLWRKHHLCENSI